VTQTKEMTEIRTLKTFSWIYRVMHKNTDIHDKLKIDNIVDEITTHTKCWKNYIDRMSEDRCPKIAWNYRLCKPKVMRKTKEMLKTRF
jgi:hypothetical protein